MHQDHRVCGLVLMAPHFFTEDMGIAAIVEARTAYETADLKAKLARWHKDPDNAFYGWNGAWLDPGFRRWDITEQLAYIRVPILIVQTNTAPSSRSRRRHGNAIARSRWRCCPASSTRRSAKRRR
jgi:hypothetical protein